MCTISITEKKRFYQIRHLDEPLEPRVMLDVDAMELDPLGPLRGIRLEQVLDLVVVDVEREDLVRSLVQELLAEVRADETAGADHADRDRLDRLPVQIQSNGSVVRHCLFVGGGWRKGIRETRWIFCHTLYYRR